MSRKKIDPEETVCVEFVEGGMTYAGAVWREGSVAVVPAHMGTLSPRTQKEKYGKQMFVEISAEEYEEIAGHPPALPVDGKVPSTSQGRTKRQTRKKSAAPPSLSAEETDQTPEPVSVPEVPAAPASPDGGDDDAEVPFEDYEAVDNDTTLDRIAQMNDAEVEAFVAYERDHRNRDEILAFFDDSTDDSTDDV